ncbi:hypothetical protein CPB85DRAFT_1249694 [Mucidula mucida]|nr:hypothetical protein CPB85DRAFT_1249694 [Mucidula mucida]
MSMPSSTDAVWTRRPLCPEATCDTIILMVSVKILTTLRYNIAKTFALHDSSRQNVVVVAASRLPDKKRKVKYIMFFMNKITDKGTLVLSTCNSFYFERLVFNLLFLAAYIRECLKPWPLYDRHPETSATSQDAITYYLTLFHLVIVDPPQALRKVIVAITGG